MNVHVGKILMLRRLITNFDVNWDEHVSMLPAPLPAIASQNSLNEAPDFSAQIREFLARLEAVEQKQSTKVERVEEVNGQVLSLQQEVKDLKKKVLDLEANNGLKANVNAEGVDSFSTHGMKAKVKAEDVDSFSTPTSSSKSSNLANVIPDLGRCAQGSGGKRKRPYFPAKGEADEG